MYGKYSIQIVPKNIKQPFQQNYELWVPVVCVKQQYDTSMPEVCSAERALSICAAGLGNFGERLRALCALLNTPQVCLLCCQSFIHWLMEITALLYKILKGFKLLYIGLFSSSVIFALLQSPHLKIAQTHIHV